MNATTETPTAPDLSRLTKRQQLNIRVAETQGSSWRFYEGGPLGSLWELHGGLRTAFHVNAAGASSGVLPDYAGDPAAWGALMEREGVWPEPYFDDGVPVLWRGFFVDERTGETIFTPFTVGQAGTAVSSAVLMKHGIDLTPYIGD